MRWPARRAGADHLARPAGRSRWGRGRGRTAAAVNYYLRRYGLPPDPELVNHARSNGFRSPEVDEQTRLAAAATITGGRPPGPPRQSGPGPGPNGIAPPVGPGGPPRPGVPAGAPPMPVGAMAAVGDVAAVMSPGGPPPPLTLPPTDEGLGAHGMGGIDERQDELDDIQLDDEHDEHHHELLVDEHDQDDVLPADPPVAPPIVLPPTAQPPVAPSIQSRSQQERTINLLRQRLADLGVPESAYRIGEPAPRTWYLEQVDGGWQVGWFDGEFSSPMLFEEVSDASAFLLGKLLLGVPAETGAPVGVAPTPPPVADRIEPLDLPAEPPLPTPVEPEAVTEQHAEPVDDHVNDRVPEAPAPPPPPIEWPIQPMAGEPPLTLFRGKRLLELQPGTEVDRFGTPEGNLTYVAGTPFEQRSLVPDWVHRPYHVYRVIRPVQALTGGAIPWFDQPGGGTAYLLPRAVAELVDNGDLVEIGPPEQPGA